MSRRDPGLRRIVVIGVGLIGGSIALTLRRRLRGVRVVGVDRPAVLRAARRRRAVHETTSSLARGLAGVDLAVLALPVDVVVKVIPRVARHLDRDAIVTDVCGTKVAVMAAARRAGLADRFVGGHPMAGSESAGIANASADLFRGAPWILCPGSSRANRAAVARVAKLVSRLGARPAFLTPGRHDQIVARLSHLPQLISVALANAAVPSAGRHLTLAGPAFRQMTRLAASPPSLWDGILKTNRREAHRAIDEFIRELRRLGTSLDRGLGEHFRRAAGARGRMRRKNRLDAS